MSGLVRSNILASGGNKTFEVDNTDQMNQLSEMKEGDICLIKNIDNQISPVPFQMGATTKKVYFDLSKNPQALISPNPNFTIGEDGAIDFNILSFSGRSDDEINTGGATRSIQIIAQWKPDGTIDLVGIQMTPGDDMNEVINFGVTQPDTFEWKWLTNIGEFVEEITLSTIYGVRFGATSIPRFSEDLYLKLSEYLYVDGILPYIATYRYINNQWNLIVNGL